MAELLTAHEVVSGWAAEDPDREFLVQPVAGELRVMTFAMAMDQARRMAAALGELGLIAGDKVAILAKNSAEWVVADLSIAMAGMISVPIYPTANPDTVAYIIGHSEAKAIFVGKLDRADAIGKGIPPGIVTVAFPYPTLACEHQWQDLINGNEPLGVMHQPAAGEPMTILYTSGSTGHPKGVVISYGAYAYGCNAARAVVSFGREDRLLSYLPLAHVTERMALVGPSVYAGGRIYFVDTLDTFAHDLKAARPTVFASVPRLWVKFQSGIHAKVPPKKLRLLLRTPIVGRLVARKIRREMGFGHCRTFASGTAPISPLTLKWYRKLGIDIGEGWGMSETSGLSCANLPYQARRLGTIGVPLEGTELKTSDEGELLIRCPGLFTEYFKQAELTAESFTSDGFFRTGDKAQWDDSCQGYRITGRVKDIFKSAKGKYVVPVPIESLLSANPLLEQICVVGSGLPAPVAVVVLSEAGRGLPRETVEASLATTLASANSQLESHEQLSHVLVVSDEWTTESGLLTPTLKLKRDKLEARYLETAARDIGQAVVWENDV